VKSSISAVERGSSMLISLLQRDVFLRLCFSRSGYHLPVLLVLTLFSSPCGAPTQAECLVFGQVLVPV
jgi:hypothetical protein